jgi:hypothetical protein
LVKASPVVSAVVAFGTLDFDHVGPEIGEEHGAKRTGEHARQIEDAYVGAR